MKQKSLQAIQGVLWYVELILNIDSMPGNNETNLYKNILFILRCD